MKIDNSLNSLSVIISELASSIEQFKSISISLFRERKFDEAESLIEPFCQFMTEKLINNIYPICYEKYEKLILKTKEVELWFQDFQNQESNLPLRVIGHSTEKHIVKPAVNIEQNQLNGKSEYIENHNLEKLKKKFKGMSDPSKIIDADYYEEDTKGTGPTYDIQQLIKMIKNNWK